MKYLSRIILTLLLAALLATPFLIRRFYHADETAKSGPRAAMDRYGFYFEEVARKSGVDFVHSAPTLDAKLDHIMPQIASMGAGVAVSDFNRDGWPDFYVTSSGEDSLNALYRNNRDGTFTNVAQELGVADVNRRDTGVSMGGLGRLRQRRLRRSFRLQMGPARAISQRRRQRIYPHDRHGKLSRIGSTP